MNTTGNKESARALELCQPKARESDIAGGFAGAKPVVLLGTTDSGLAQRLSRELKASLPMQSVVAATGLAQLRELARIGSPGVIFLDSDLLGGLPLIEAVYPMAVISPVLVLAPLNAQADMARVLSDDRVDFVARVGDFVPLASALIVRRLKASQMTGTLGGMWKGPFSSGIAELFRHEINNPLTGILGNAELVLARKEHLSGVEIQRLQTVVDLAVRLRENIRRISNSWDVNCSPKAS